MSLNLVKSIAVRAVRTFLQAFGTQVAAGAFGVWDVSTAKQLAVSAVMAGVAAAWRVLDTAPVPSLVDRHATAGVPT